MGVFNFAAGPSRLPRPVLEQARDALTDWNGTGLSIMEIPFTGPEFTGIMEDAVASLAALLEIPSNYRVLFLQGGASGMFSAVPMNLLRGRGGADYAVTGHWSRRAAGEAAKYCAVNIAADGAANGYTDIPAMGNWTCDPDSAYRHITTNETADGVQFHELPETGAVPLVADMTADFLTGPLDVGRFGAVYASAQKNIGPAGLTVVVVREDLLGDALPSTPAIFDFARQAASNSRLNTPPTWSIFVAGLVFKWVQSEGGLAAMARRNERKARLLYDVIDAGGFYDCPVAPAVRSTVNIRFHLPGEDLEQAFLAEAAARGLLNLKGHSAIGGIRASLYNAVGEEAVEALAAFMDEFAMAWGGDGRRPAASAT